MRRVGLAMVVLVLAALAATAAMAQGISETLTLTEIKQINETGFGGKVNKYAWSMAVYNDALYVGTLNVDNMRGMFNFFAGTSMVRSSQGAEIWRWDKEGAWTRVVEKGMGNPRNYGVRKLLVIDKCLYGVTANHDDGFEVWRTCDGETWEKTAAAGFGDPHNTSGRGLGFFNGMIYVGAENRQYGAQLWRSADGQKWEMVADKGVSDPGNIWLSDMVAFQGRLYMGTLNLKGFQVYRTRDGRHFERVAAQGIGKTTNWGALKLHVFKDKLFVASQDYLQGFDLYVTEDGINFEAALEKGFKDRHYGYLWQLEEYHGRLYAGLYYHRGFRLPKGRFGLISSADGEEWEVENDNGFGNDYQYGVRSMAVFNDQLLLGTASAKFGCRVYAAQGKVASSP